MSSILKRISSLSKISNKLLKNQSKIGFNLEEPEFLLNNKFGLNTSKKKSTKYVENTDTKTCIQTENPNFDNSIETCIQHNNKIEQ